MGWKHFSNLFGNIECLAENLGSNCRFCGVGLAYEHKPTCPGSYACTLCGHLKSDHLNQEPCTPRRGMCLCQGCKYFAGSSPPPSPAPPPSQYAPSPGFFTKALGWVITIASITILIWGAWWIITGIISGLLLNIIIADLLFGIGGFAYFNAARMRGRPIILSWRGRLILIFGTLAIIAVNVLFMLSNC